MTQDEVDLIYTYLHENYRYKEGQLIRIKDLVFHKKDSSLGGFFSNCKTPYEKVTLRIAGRDRSAPLSHLIYLFFNKVRPEVIKYKDGNSLNNNIENLEACTKVQMQHSNRDLKSFLGYSEKTLKNGDKAYRSVISLKGIKVSLGQFKTKEEAISNHAKAKEIILNNPNINPIELRKLFRVNKFPKGVHKRRNKFVARIYFNYKDNFLGSFDTPEEAHAAYLKAKKELTNQ